MSENNNLMPNYYAIIPASVRYDKDLTPNAKLLYGEITSLCNEKGYCWANNAYFMELYGCSERSVQMLLKQLNDKGYIQIILEKNKFRKIFILDNPEKYCGVPRKNFRPNPEKNFTHNNKKNIKEEYDEEKKINKKEIFDYDWLNDIS